MKSFLPCRTDRSQIFQTITCNECGRVYQCLYADRRPTQAELELDRALAMLDCPCRPRRYVGRVAEFHVAT